MSATTIMGMVGLLATLILGILGIYYAFRFRTQPRLTYVRDEFIPLFKSIVQSIDGIEISHGGRPIDQNLLLLKGSLLNTGSSDIDPSVIHEPLQLKLPPNCNALKAKITNSSAEVGAACKIIDSNTIEFNWNLLKKGEFVTFDALLEEGGKAKDAQESKEEDHILKLEKKIKFKHRITNLDRVAKENLFSIQRSRKLRRMVPLLLINLVMVTLMIGMTFFRPEKRCVFSLQMPDGQTKQVFVNTRFKDKMRMQSQDKSVDEKLTVQEFKVRYKYPIDFVDNKAERITGFAFGGAMLILHLCALGFYWYIRSRDQKIRNLLGIGNN